MFTIESLFFAATMFLVALGFSGVYFGTAAWAVGDAQRRGHTGGLIIILFWMFGPLAALIWYFARPSTTVAERPVNDYTNPDDAIAAAVRLDSLGERDAALALFQNTAQKWPEHEQYVKACVESILKKKSLGQ